MQLFTVVLFFWQEPIGLKPVMYPILLKEITGFLSSVVGYVVICIFLTATGLFLWVYPETNLLDFAYADLQTLFRIGPFVFIFLIPAITMRSFAEERRSGTMELLLTRPITEMQIILGKYLAAWLLVLLSLLPTGLYYFTLYTLGNPQGNIDSAAVTGSYAGMLLLGGVFAALGLFASALFDNQVVAFITGAFLCWFLYQGLGGLAINIWSVAAPYIKWAGMDYHYDALGKGVIDTRDLTYFGRLITLMLAATRLSLQKRNW